MRCWIIGSSIGRDDFKPLKKRAVNNFKVFGFDVETYQSQANFFRKNGNEVHALRQDFLMGSVVGDGVKRVFWDKQDMREFLLSRTTRDSMIFATNLEFDLNQLFRIPGELYPIFRHRLIAAIKVQKNESDKRVVSYKGGKREYYVKRRWLFSDTLNFMQVPLSRLGRMVGIEKLGKPACFCRKPKTYVEKREMEEYNLNDSLITYKFAEMLKSFCTEHNMKLKLTTASTGMDFWRRNYQKHPMKREMDWMIDKHFEGSFRGGMTQVFKRGLFKQPLWYYDYRSSYPGVMLKGVDGSGEYPDPSSYKYFGKPSQDIIDHYEGISRAVVEIPYCYVPSLGVKIDNKLLFPYGFVEGWFTNKELRDINNDGGSCHVKESVSYTANFRPFKDAVQELYSLRKKYKLQRHPYEQMIKLIMNSGLFGKWGTNHNKMEELIPLSDVVFRNSVPYLDGKELSMNSLSCSTDLMTGFITHKTAVKPFRYSFPILASYTTMLGRLKLIHAVRKHEKALIYTDTDSAVMSRPCLIESDELGGWELEHKLKGGLFIRPKLYMIFKGDDVVCKSKGVGKYMSTEKDFVQALHAGRVDMQRFMRMKESNRLNVKPGTIIRMSKRIGVEDDKRQWPGKFDEGSWQDSKPIFNKIRMF